MVVVGGDGWTVKPARQRRNYAHTRLIGQIRAAPLYLHSATYGDVVLMHTAAVCCLLLPKSRRANPIMRPASDGHLFRITTEKTAN